MGGKEFFCKNPGGARAPPGPLLAPSLLIQVNFSGATMDDLCS